MLPGEGRTQEMVPHVQSIFQECFHLRYARTLLLHCASSPQCWKMTNGWNIFQLWHHAEFEHIEVDTPCFGLRIKQQDRQCTHHVTMWHVRLTIGIMEKQRWLHFVLLTYKALPWNNNGFPWHCYRATICSVMLSTIRLNFLRGLCKVPHILIRF